MAVGLARAGGQLGTKVRRHGAPPLSLRLIALAVAAAAALPLAYLALRALEGGPDALAPLLRERTLRLLVSTVALGLGVGVGAAALGVPLAWLTTRTDLPWARAMAVISVAPLAVPSYVLAFAFVAALGSGGWLLEVPWLHGYPGTVLVLTLVTTPYVVLTTRAALARLDPSVEEAARSLGDGAWHAMRVAVLPVILPAVGVGALLAALYAISDFGAVSILRYDSLARAVHTQYRLSFDRSGAAALALVLVALAFVIVWVERRLRRRISGVAVARHRGLRIAELRRWRWAAMSFCVLVGGLSLALPALTILVWLWRGLAAGVDVRLDAGLVSSSLVLGVSTTILAVTVAVPLARLVTGYPGRWAALVEQLTSGIYAVPAISLALAFVFLTLHAVPVLYQSLAALVIAVSLRFLVQPVAALRGPLAQVSPRTVEAARSLGERPLGVLRTITLPLIRPGIVAGAGVVLLSTLKELPLTLLLAPTGFRTLAIGVWDAAREGFYAQAAVPAALLLIVSLLSVAVLVRGGEVATR